MLNLPLAHNETIVLAMGGSQQTKTISSEIYSNNQWYWANIEIPSQISAFCVTFRDEKTLVVVGGVINDKSNNNFNTYFLDLSTNQWTLGPKILSCAGQCQCGRIKSSDLPVIE